MLIVLVAAAFALTSASADASYIHPEPGYEFGPTGLSTSSFPGNVAEMDFDQSSKRIFLLNKNETKIYSMHFEGPGTYSPSGVPFPLSVAGSGCCTDIAIDNTAGASAENLYYSPDGEPILGYTPAGAALPAFSPISGEKCGVGVDNEGHLWTGNFSTREMEEFEPTGGAPINTVDVSATGAPCRVRFDLSNNDMYVPQYFGDGTIRYTAASGYAPGSAQVFGTTTNATVAINATRHVVYVAGSQSVSAYDTATGSLLETFGEEGGCGINGVAVDDATDTVFLSRGCTNRIQEWKGAVVPDAVTGEPTGNSQVSGSVALAGGGEVTDCKFEFGETTAYGQEAPCEPAAPYTSDQALVTAELKNDLEGETHLSLPTGRLKCQRDRQGVDKTITPHNVKVLATGPASEITNNSARVSGTFEGNGEDTRYWFEWGRTTHYGHQTPLPPGRGRRARRADLTEDPHRSDRTRPGRDLPLPSRRSQRLRNLARAHDATFTTYQPPSIDGFSSSGITATSADISAGSTPTGSKPNTKSSMDRQRHMERAHRYRPACFRLATPRKPSRIHLERSRRDRLPLPRRRPQHLGNHDQHRSDVHILPTILPELGAAPKDREQLPARLPRLRAGQSRDSPGNIMLRANSSAGSLCPESQPLSLCRPRRRA